MKKTHTIIFTEREREKGGRNREGEREAKREKQREREAKRERGRRGKIVSEKENTPRKTCMFGKIHD